MGLWQRLPVPAQSVFQKKIGYGRGCPWKCHDIEIEYRIDDYPEARDFMDSHCYVFDVNPPNDLETMGLYADAFQKVMSNLDQVVD
jgi:hypothetical protein